MTDQEKLNELWDEYTTEFEEFIDSQINKLKVKIEFLETLKSKMQKETDNV